MNIDEIENKMNNPEEDALDLESLNLSEGTKDILSTLGVNSRKNFDFTSDSNTVADDEETQNELTQIEETVVEETIDLNVSEPNIIIPKTELIRALRYASIMIRKITNDIESSRLNITYKDDGSVEYKLKDNMTWVTLKGTCKVSNNNPLLKTLSFTTTYLTKLLSAASSDVLLYEGKSTDYKNEEVDVVYIRLSNGDYIVDCVYGNESKLIPAGNKSDKLCSLQSKIVTTLCDTMIPMISDTQEVQYKRTALYEDKAIFRSSTYLLCYKNIFTKMCLGKKELDLLKLTSLYADSEIEIYSTDSIGENRILIVAPNVTISTSVSVPNVDETLNARINELDNAKYMEINYNELKKVLMLSGIGMGSVGRVELNYSIENNGLDAKTVGKLGNSNLLIPGNNYNNLEPRSEKVTIYSPNLITLLKAFESGKKLEVALLSSGLALRDENLGIEAIMNYASGS